MLNEKLYIGKNVLWRTKLISKIVSLAVKIEVDIRDNLVYFLYFNQ